MENFVRQVVGPIFFTLFVFGYIWILLREIRNIVTGFKAIFWPKSIGLITKSEIIHPSIDSGTGYEAAIEYSYVVGDKKYSSSVTYLGTLNRAAKWPANYLAKKYELNKSAVVSYNPKSPSESVLETGASILLLNTATILILFGVIAYYFLYGLIGIFKKLM